jgi:hypothetical protein
LKDKEQKKPGMVNRLVIIALGRFKQVGHEFQVS